MAMSTIVPSASHILALCLVVAYVPALLGQPAYLVMKTMTVIEKPSCFVMPSSSALKACAEEKRSAQVEFLQPRSKEGNRTEEKSVNQGDLPKENLDIHSLGLEDLRAPQEFLAEPLLEPSFQTPVDVRNFWGLGFLNQRPSETSLSTMFVTTTLSLTQRLVPECTEPNEKYEPRCPPKEIKTKWGYHGLFGPAKWDNVDVVCGSGEEGSPIEITTKDTIFAKYAPMERINYDKNPTNYVVTNNGHTLVISVVGPSPPVIMNGGMRSVYQFAQMHFHWGEISQEGSEHVLNGKRYPMELHMVHFNRQYKSLGNAVTHRDGLEVLGIFFEVSSEDNPVLQPLVQILNELILPNTTRTLPGASFLLNDFLPGDEGFYRYRGSLTTPNCNQVVDWNVFSKPVKISEKQIAAFRKLKDSDGGFQSGNFRPLQRPVGREVFRNFDALQD